MKGTQKDFAEKKGWTKQYVSKLKKQNRLVFTKDGQVDFEKSEALIASTEDPSKVATARMQMTVARPTKKSVKKSQKTAKPTVADPEDFDDDDGQEELSIPTNGVTHLYQKSRADKEDAAAKLKNIEYERELGRLVYKEDVEKYISKAVKIARDKLLAIPTRLAPRVTVETDQKNNFAIISKEVEDVIQEIQQGLADFRS